MDMFFNVEIIRVPCIDCQCCFIHEYESLPNLAKEIVNQIHSNNSALPKYEKIGWLKKIVVYVQRTIFGIKITSFMFNILFLVFIYFFLNFDMLTYFLATDFIGLELL